ncbi:CCC motif membrane protein [Maribacter sp. 2307ULW6-5]|uniref:CCC motif membrane protein n=1 Tax=Maribacter sp. 2307ULW6-5 TaxID=3386275 RepID=UPI0039BC2A0C
MTTKQLPNSTTIYLLSLLGLFLFCFAGVGLVPSVIAFIMAKKSERLYAAAPHEYSHGGKVKKGKVLAIVGIVLNLIIVGVAIWTLMTIGWDAWSDEFVRKWNAGLESGTR